MKRSRICIFLCGVFCVFLADAVPAAQPAPGQKVGRACVMSDLVGTWEMKSLNSKIKTNPKDPFAWPYQRFIFDKKGDVKEMTAQIPIEGNRAAIQKFENSLSLSRYSLDERGVLSITKLELHYPERCLCAYVTRDLPPEALAKIPEAKKAKLPKKGDILLTYFGKDGKPTLSKILRKIR